MKDVQLGPDKKWQVLAELAQIIAEKGGASIAGEHADEALRNGFDAYLAGDRATGTASLTNWLALQLQAGPEHASTALKNLGRWLDDRKLPPRKAEPTAEARVAQSMLRYVSEHDAVPARWRMRKAYSEKPVENVYALLEKRSGVKVDDREAWKGSPPA